MSTIERIPGWLPRKLFEKSANLAKSAPIHFWIIFRCLLPALTSGCAGLGGSQRQYMLNHAPAIILGSNHAEAVD